MIQQFLEFAMNIQLIGGEGFYHKSLNRSIRGNSFECFYAAGDEFISNSIVDCFDDVSKYLKEFYEIKDIPFAVIYVYHDLRTMNEVFKRELPNDQCCFVQIVGDVSLLTFTSKIGGSSVRQILAHELSHIEFSFLSGSQEVDDIQQTIPLWLNEGIAMYIDKNTE